MRMEGRKSFTFAVFLFFFFSVGPERAENFLITVKREALRCKSLASAQQQQQSLKIAKVLDEVKWILLQWLSIN
jgi:hypothetical protein